MKKILFIIPTISQTNGVTAFLINYLKNMDLSKFNIEVVYDDYRPSKEYEEILKELKIKVYKLPYIKKIGILEYRKSVKNFLKLHHDYDLIYSNVSYKSIFYFSEAKKYKIKNIAIHSHATQSSDKKINNIMGNIIQIKVNKYTNYKLACSELAGEAMFKNKKFTIINNAIDYNKYRFNFDIRKRIRKELKIKDDNIILGFVGRFTQQKNVYFFIDLIKKLPDKYMVFMIGNGFLKNDFLKRIKEEKIENRFIFKEETTNVYEYYSVFDCFLLPSLYEGLPIVSIEAQANGLPCLLSNTISDECKISTNIVYLDKSNIEEWAKNINEMKRKESVKLNDDYNIKIQAKNFEKILYNLCI